MNTVILIGFMGAGKTTVGQALSDKSGLPLVDTDQRIVDAAGMEISEIFSSQGEEAFRRFESSVLKELLKEKKPAVISVGGGFPLREENRAGLRLLGTVVYLEVTLETVLKRLEGDTARPLLAGPDGRRKAEALLKERGPVYRKAADLTVAVDEKSVDEITVEVFKRLEESL